MFKTIGSINPRVFIRTPKLATQAAANRERLGVGGALKTQVRQAGSLSGRECGGAGGQRPRRIAEAGIGCSGLRPVVGTRSRPAAAGCRDYAKAGGGSDTIAVPGGIITSITWREMETPRERSISRGVAIKESLPWESLSSSARRPLRLKRKRPRQRAPRCQGLPMTISKSVAHADAG